MACPERATTPLDLESDQLAAWRAAVEGSHQVPLTWQRPSSTDSVTGFDESNQLMLDIVVVQGQDVEYTSGGYASGGAAYDESSGCDGRRGRRLQLEIELATGDASLHGSLRHWVEMMWTGLSVPSPAEDLHTASFMGSQWYPLESLSSSFEFRLENGESWTDATLGLVLFFRSGRVAGEITLAFAGGPQDGEPVLVGTFPDDS